MLVLSLLSGLLVALSPGVAQADEAGGAGDFVPLAGGRLVDTRLGTGAPKAVVGPGKTITFAAVGLAGVPATGVRAVYLTTAVIGPTAATYLTLYPSGTTKPSMSNLNAAASSPALSNSAIVPVGSD